MFNSHVVEEFDSQEGYTLKIVLDPDPFDPFEDDDGKLSTFIFEHSRYNLGDMGREEFAVKYPEIVNTSDPLHAPTIISDHPDVLAFEFVEMLDHSGLRFYLQRDRLKGNMFIPYSGWDSGIVGPAVVTKQDFLRVGLDPDAPDAIERARDAIRVEIEMLDAYHSGEVYGYEVVDYEGYVVDSCYGFYGSAGEREAEAEGKAALEDLVQEARDERYTRTQQYKQQAFALGV